MYETLLLTCRLIIVDSSQDLTNMGGLSQKFTNGTQLVSTLHNLMLHMVREWYVQCIYYSPKSMSSKAALAPSTRIFFEGPCSASYMKKTPSLTMGFILSTYVWKNTS